MESRIGMVFGELTILAEAEINKSGHRLYLCECSCGNTKKATFSHLNNGYIKSCGHLRNESSLLNDLTDQRFDRLVVVERAKSGKSGKSRWKCRCDCGNCIIKFGSRLVDGTATQCRECSNLIVDSDLEGMMFGRLLVVEFVEQQGSKKFWECRCECGNRTITNSYKLVGGYTRSCGCLLWEGYGEIGRSFYTSKKRDAKERSIEFNVDIEYLWNIFLQQNRRCALSGVELFFKNYGYKKYNEEQTASIDRIDSKLGYIEGNIQWVHKQINFMKQTLTQEEFIQWCSLVFHNQTSMPIEK